MRKETFAELYENEELEFIDCFLLQCKHPLSCIHHHEIVVFTTVSPWTNAYANSSASFRVRAAAPHPDIHAILLPANHVRNFVLNPKNFSRGIFTSGEFRFSTRSTPVRVVGNASSHMSLSGCARSSGNRPVRVPPRGARLEAPRVKFHAHPRTPKVRPYFQDPASASLF